MRFIDVPDRIVQELGLKKPKRKQQMKPHGGFASKTELRYAEHLEKLKLIGEIRDYAYEAETIKMCVGCTYTPDFLVITKNEEREFHEVKGTKIGKRGMAIPRMVSRDQKPRMLWAAQTIWPTPIYLAFFHCERWWHRQVVPRDCKRIHPLEPQRQSVKGVMRS